MNSKFIRFLKKIGTGLVAAVKAVNKEIDYGAIRAFIYFMVGTWLLGKFGIWSGLSNHLPIRIDNEPFVVGSVILAGCILIIGAIGFLFLSGLVLKKMWDES